MVAMVMMIARSMRYIWPCHVANRASCGCPDGSADKRAGPRPHQPIIQPLAGRRGAPGQSDARKKNGDKTNVGHCHIPHLAPLLRAIGCRIERITMRSDQPT
jgi:hypothetical protein